MEPRWCCPAPGRRRIAPTLAGIPERVGFFGEGRFGLINRIRWDEKSKRLPRFIDQNASLALPPGAKLPPEWPVPQLRVAARGSRPLAAGQRARHRTRGGAGTRLGRRVQALDLLPGGRAAAGRARFRRLGDRRPRRKGAGAGDRRRRRQQGSRPHRHRPAQRRAGDGRRLRRHHQRLRPDAYRSRDRHADDGHFRPDQPLSLGAAERPCGDRADHERNFPASPASARSAP